MSTTPPGEGHPERNPDEPYAYPPPPGSTPPPGGYPEPGGYPGPGQSRPGQQPQGHPPADLPHQGGYPEQRGYPEQGGGPAGGYGSPAFGGHGYPGYGHPGGADPVPPADDPLVPADLGGWFQRVVGVFNRSFAQLAILQVIASAANAIVAVLVLGDLGSKLTTLEQFNQRAASGPPPTPEEMAAIAPLLGEVFTSALIAGLVGLAVALFVQAASVYVAVRHATGQPATAADGLRFAPGRALPLIGWGVVAWLLVSIGAVLILPALYLAIVFGATLIGVVVIEKGGIGRCFRLAHSRFVPAAARVLLSFVLAMAYAFVAQSIASLVGGQFSPVASIVQALLMIPLGIFGTAVVVVTYAELRFHEHGTTAPALARELD